MIRVVPDPYFLPLLDPGVKKRHRIPDLGSATLIKNCIFRQAFEEEEDEDEDDEDLDEDDDDVDDDDEDLDEDDDNDVDEEEEEEDEDEGRRRWPDWVGYGY